MEFMFFYVVILYVKFAALSIVPRSVGKITDLVRLKLTTMALADI